MNQYISYLTEANIGLLLFALVYMAFLQKDQSFVLKRLLIILMLLASAVFPLLSFNTFFNQSVGGTSGINGYYLPAILLSAEGAAVTAKAESYSLLSVGFCLYWLVASALFVQLVVRLAGLLKRQLTGRIIKTIGAVRVCEAGSNEYAFSFFRYVFVGQMPGIDERARNKIIDHELVHCREWHSLDILFVELLRVLFWFNPAIYILKTALVEAHEYRADQLSVSKGEEQMYCSLIAKLALNGAGYQIANHFNKSLTLKRITMIKSDKSATKWWKLAAVAPVTLLFFAFVSCEQQPSAEAADEIEVARAGSEQEIFTIVEELPAFPGGMENLYQYFGSNLKYPEEAKAAGVEGKVLVEFVVGKDGEVSDARVIEGIGKECDDEALRVVAASPAWAPAKQRGKKVRTRLILPIYFTLGTEGELEVPAVPTIVQDPMKIEIKKSKNENNQTVINGVVKLETGEGIPGANIIFAGTTFGTVSDLDGAFKLVTEKESGELVVSFVGFKTEKAAF